MSEVTIYFQGRDIYEVYSGNQKPSCSVCCNCCDNSRQCQQVEVKWRYKLLDRIVAKCHANGDDMNWINDVINFPIQKSIAVLCDECNGKFQTGADRWRYLSGRDDNDYIFSAHCDWAAKDKLERVISSAEEVEETEDESEDSDDE